MAHEVAALLGRLKAAMDIEKEFAANSAHELRTPIASALAQTQRLAVELGDHPAGSRVLEVENSLRQLSQLSEKLLQLARLDAGFALSDVRVDLEPVVELVVRDFRKPRRRDIARNIGDRRRCAFDCVDRPGCLCDGAAQFDSERR